MKQKTIAVIGLGRFGMTIAKMLASMNHEVLGVDINPDIVQKISPYLTHAIVADTTDEEMHISKVVAKAENSLQGKMLQKIGVDQVIYPEYDMALRLVQSLTREHVMDYLQLSKNISLIEISMPPFMVGRCLKDSKLREQYNLNAVGVRRSTGLDVPPDPTAILSEDDKLLVIGNNSDLDELTK